MTLKEMRAQLAAKREALAAIFKEGGGAGPDLDLDKITSIDGDGRAKLHEIRQRREEIDRLQKDTELAADLIHAQEQSAIEDAKREEYARKAHDTGVRHPLSGEPLPTKAEPVNIGRLAVKAMRARPGEAFTAVMDGVEPGSLKANFVTGAGWAPESLRIPGLVIGDAHQRPMLIDVIPSATTSQSSVSFMEESTYSNAAAERAEAAQYAESSYALTERVYPVRVVGHLVPVSDEQLADVEGAESYLNSRLTMGIRERVSSQILKGTGAGVQLAGLQGVAGFNTSTALNQQANNDSIINTVKRAATAVETTGAADPNLVAMHPEDFDTVRTARATTATTGEYLWGHPALAGVRTLWGMEVVTTTEQTKGTVLVGDTRYCALYERRGIVIEVGLVGNNFRDGLRTIRAGIRVAMARYRGPAFTRSTGLKA